MTGVRRGLFATGGLLMAYAAVGAVTDADVKIGALFFLAGSLVAHDALLLPATIVLGVLIGRVVPRRAQPLLRAALIIGLAVTVVAFPLVLGRGRAADNASLLPLPYGRGLLEIYGVIGGVVAVALVVQMWRDRRRTTTAPPDTPE
jgi:hypothetical protein